MARFLDPPPPKPLLPEEKIPKVYKSMRFKVFLGAFLGYSAYYLVRKNLSLAAPGMIGEGLITKAQIGVAMSAVSIAYAFSKFILGSISDRSDARKFLVLGLVPSAGSWPIGYRRMSGVSRCLSGIRDIISEPAPWGFWLRRE